MRFPGATILAVDLSVTSLAYAKRKTQELGIGNIEYYQADILALASSNDRIEPIECVGFSTTSRTRWLAGTSSARCFVPPV
jgi:ubiquinone/menaquinone biosynthesis C-methylase UbiE